MLVMEKHKLVESKMFNVDGTKYLPFRNPLILWDRKAKNRVMQLFIEKKERILTFGVA
jgi:hypothetical protein